MIWNQTWNEYDDYLGTGVWGFNSSIYTVGWVDDWSIDYTGMVLVSWSDQEASLIGRMFGELLVWRIRFRRTLGLFHLHIRNPCLLFRLE